MEILCNLLNKRITTDKKNRPFYKMAGFFRVIEVGVLLFYFRIAELPENAELKIISCQFISRVR